VASRGKSTSHKPSLEKCPLSPGQMLYLPIKLRSPFQVERTTIATDLAITWEELF